MQGAHKVMCLI